MLQSIHVQQILCLSFWHCSLYFFGSISPSHKFFFTSSFSHFFHIFAFCTKFCFMIFFRGLLSLSLFHSTSVRCHVHIFCSVISWRSVLEAENEELHLLLFQVSAFVVSQQRVPKAWHTAAFLSTPSSAVISSRKIFSSHIHIYLSVAFFKVDDRNSW